MTELILKEWRHGLKKVSAVKLLQQRAGLSLTSAKRCVDRLLKDETVSIAMANYNEARDLGRELTSLGVICEVRSNGHLDDS